MSLASSSKNRYNRVYCQRNFESRVMEAQTTTETGRLRFLADAGRALATSLDYETTLQNITRLIIPAFADWCVIDLVEGDDTRRVAAAHSNPDQITFLEALLQEYPTEANNPYGYQAVIKAAKSQIVPVILPGMFAEIAIDARHLELIRQLQLKSNLCVPLILRDKVLGAITFAYAESGRVYTQDDLAFAEELAQRIALAIEQARLYETERRLRKQAEASTERLLRLQTLTAAFCDTQTLKDVVDVVALREFVPMGVHLGVIALHSEDKKTLELIGHYAIPPILDERYLRVQMDTALPITDTVRTGKPIWIPTAAAYAQAYLHAAEDILPHTQTQAMAALPLIIEGKVIGAIGMSFSEPQAFTNADCAFMMAVAQQCAQGVQRAILREQAKVKAADEERQRLARDLHDAVSQTLFSATTISEAIPTLWKRNPARAIEQIGQIVVLNRAAMAELRSLLLELRSEAIVKTLMNSLLIQLVEAVKGRKQIEIELRCEGNAFTLDPNAHVAFYRIAQESLNNIVKHSRATQVNIDFVAHSGCWKLRVEDNGHGFDMNLLSAGMGMNTMRERAEVIGAMLEISSLPGKGTRIILDYTSSQPANV